MNDRADTIKIIRAELKRRSDRTWSITGGRGTAYGWITISAPPARMEDGWKMTESDRAKLAELLGLDYVHHQGVTIASSSAHYTEYVDRARGLTPVKIAQPYWD